MKLNLLNGLALGLLVLFGSCSKEEIDHSDCLTKEDVFNIEGTATVHVTGTTENTGYKVDETINYNQNSSSTYTDDGDGMLDFNINRTTDNLNTLNNFNLSISFNEDTKEIETATLSIKNYREIDSKNWLNIDSNWMYYSIMDTELNQIEDFVFNKTDHTISGKIYYTDQNYYSDEISASEMTYEIIFDIPVIKEIN